METENGKWKMHRDVWNSDNPLHLLTTCEINKLQKPGNPGFYLPPGFKNCYFEFAR